MKKLIFLNSSLCHLQVLESNHPIAFLGFQIINKISKLLELAIGLHAKPG